MAQGAKGLLCVCALLGGGVSACPVRNWWYSEQLQPGVGCLDRQNALAEDWIGDWKEAAYIFFHKLLLQNSPRDKVANDVAAITLCCKVATFLATTVIGGARNRGLLTSSLDG
ncbi:hypothetical protein GQ53DRAFT_200544 [Thozetella sp. PMI_491]|nr:hypothetical protein GQ53DRAFT_200544 [Thozetella sp. PMI_491]